MPYLKHTSFEKLNGNKSGVADEETRHFPGSFDKLRTKHFPAVVVCHQKAARRQPLRSNERAKCPSDGKMLQLVCVHCNAITVLSRRQRPYKAETNCEHREFREQRLQEVSRENTYHQTSRRIARCTEPEGTVAGPYHHVHDQHCCSQSLLPRCYCRLDEMPCKWNEEKKEQNKESWWKWTYRERAKAMETKEKWRDEIRQESIQW